MVGDKIPWTNARARAYLKYNETRGTERKKVKRQARREVRRFEKSIGDDMIGGLLDTLQ